MKTLKSLSLALAFTAAAAGAAHAAGSTGRVIEVTPQTRWINVTQGEIVTLKVGDKAVPLQVNTYPNVQAVPLSKLAPEAAVARTVTVYIAPGQGYQAG